MRPKERVSTQGMESVFESSDATEVETVEAQTVEVRNNNRVSENVSIAIDEVLTKLTEQFSRQLNAEKEVIFSLKKELEDKERQLKLLPDFQKQAEDERRAAELKELEAEALRKQIEAMQAIQIEAEESKRLAEEEIQCFKAEKEAEAKKLEEENEQLRKKAEEATLSLEKLHALEQQMQKLQTPWWKKLFSATEN